VALSGVYILVSPLPFMGDLRLLEWHLGMLEVLDSQGGGSFASSAGAHNDHEKGIQISFRRDN
jgi:hypothetical protein